MNPNSKISLQRLAKELGLAKSTVSMALRDDPRVALATRQRVKEAASQLGYSADADVATLMARIQARKPPTYHANLALIQISKTRVATREFDGCYKRAAELGYKIDHIEDYQQYANPLKLLEARGIQGVVFIGWPWREYPQDWEKLLPICNRLANAVLASKPDNPMLNSVTNDAYLSMHLACQKLLSLGYQRPSACVNKYLDNAQDGAFTGAFLEFQRRLPTKDRIAPNYDLYNPKLTIPWIEKVKPDCIITHDAAQFDTLQQAGYDIPGDIGFAHLDLNADHYAKGFSGIDQNHHLLGEVAVDAVVAQIQRSEFGVPKTRRCIAVDAIWVSGQTTVSRLVS